MFNMILSACSVVGVRAWEEPAYQTKLQEGKFEIREYQPYLVAEVYMEGEDFEQASGDGFRILADYIFGNNLSRSSAVQMAAKAEKESESIAMTAPVQMSGRAGKPVANGLQSACQVELGDGADSK